MSYAPLRNWQAGKDSNPRHLPPEGSVLPLNYRPKTCGREDRTSAATTYRCIGGEARDRTGNRWNQNPLLCQLSYLPTLSRRAELATRNGVAGENRTLDRRVTASRSTTELRPHLTPAHARHNRISNHRLPEFDYFSLPSIYLVPGVRIELTFTAFQTVANPSQLSRRTWWTHRESNPDGWFARPLLSH